MEPALKRLQALSKHFFFVGPGRLLFSAVSIFTTFFAGVFLLIGFVHSFRRSARAPSLSSSRRAARAQRLAGGQVIHSFQEVQVRHRVTRFVVSFTEQLLGAPLRFFRLMFSSFSFFRTGSFLKRDAIFLSAQLLPRPYSIFLGSALALASLPLSRVSRPPALSKQLEPRVVLSRPLHSQYNTLHLLALALRRELRVLLLHVSFFIPIHLLVDFICLSFEVEISPAFKPHPVGVEGLYRPFDESASPRSGTAVSPANRALARNTGP